MRDLPDTDPAKAGPPQDEARSAPGRPTPARSIARPEPSDTSAPGGPSPSAAPQEAEEATLEADGARWTVRVLGRAGGVGDRSAALLLLGFWPNEGTGEHAREALIPARSLAEVTPDRLAEALARSVPRPQDERRKPFFESVSQGRRGGGQHADP